MTTGFEFVQDHFRTIISKEFFYTMCGEYLGGGVDRMVFESATDPTCVVKIAARPHGFQNVHEWDLWKQHNAHGGTSVCNWLAPCVRISENGLILVQKRTKPVPWKWKLPRRVPNVLTSDLKRDNWGIYRGRLVCHDYGRHDAIFYASKVHLGANFDDAHWIGAAGGRFCKLYGDDS